MNSTNTIILLPKESVLLKRRAQQPTSHYKHNLVNTNLVLFWRRKIKDKRSGPKDVNRFDQTLGQGWLRNNSISYCAHNDPASTSSTSFECINLSFLNRAKTLERDELF